MNETLKAKIMLMIFPADLICFFSENSKKTISEISRAKNTATNLQEMLRRKYKNVRTFKTVQYLPNVKQTPTVEANIPKLDTFEKDLENDALYGAFNEFATKLMDAHKHAGELLPDLDWEFFLTEDEMKELEEIKKEPAKIKELKDSLATSFDGLTVFDVNKIGFKYLTPNEIETLKTRSVKPEIIETLAKQIAEHNKLMPKEVDQVIFDEMLFSANILSAEDKFKVMLASQRESAAGNYILNRKQNSRDPRNFLYEISNEDYVEHSEPGKGDQITVFMPGLTSAEVEPYVKEFYKTQAIHNTSQKTSNGLKAKITRAVNNERRRLDDIRKAKVEEYEKEYQVWNEKLLVLNEQYRTESNNFNALILTLTKEYRDISETRRIEINNLEKNHRNLVSSSIEAYKTKSLSNRNAFDAFFEKLGIYLPQAAFEIYETVKSVSSSTEGNETVEGESE